MVAPDAGDRLHHSDVEQGGTAPDPVISEDHNDASHSEDSDEDSQGSRHEAVLHAPPLPPSTLPIRMAQGQQVGQTGQPEPVPNLPTYIQNLEAGVEQRFAEECFHGPLIHHSHHHHYFTRKHRYHFWDNSRHYHINHVHHHHYHDHHNHYYYPFGDYNGFNGNGNFQILQTQLHPQFPPVGVPFANADLNRADQGRFCFPFIRGSLMRGGGALHLLNIQQPTVLELLTPILVYNRPDAVNARCCMFSFKLARIASTS